MNVLRRRLNGFYVYQNLVKEGFDRHIHTSSLRAETVTTILAKAAARDIVVMDMRQKCPFTDTFILATANNERHIDRLGKTVLFAVISFIHSEIGFQLKEEMRESKNVDLSKDLPPEIQGEGSSEWMVIDAGTILVHIMTETKRTFLDLQNFWEEQGESISNSENTIPMLTKDTIRVDSEDI